MIRALKRQFILINMVIVVAILLSLFGYVLVSTARQLREDSLEVLKRAVDSQLGEAGERPHDAPGPAAPDRPFRLPYFTLSVDREGTVALIDGGYFQPEGSETDLKSMAEACLSDSSDTGVIEGYGLRYYRVATEDGWCIACADLTLERNVLAGLLRTCAAVGGVALAVLFLASVLLSKWAVRPAEQSWRRQRQFVADASHELKTPLTVVLSNVELMSDRTKDERDQRRLTSIRSAALRMKDLVEGLLELAAADADAGKETFSTVDLSETMTALLLAFEAVAYEQGHPLDERLKPGLTVMGNGEKLQRVLGILLDNACKYSDPGSPITVTLTSERANARLTVASHGEPVPREELPRLFERFYRRDAARTSGGYGLGLAIAAGIIREHGGKIGAESSAVKRENVFWIELPLHRG